MAETVEFASNGTTASGYLARPTGGRGAGVVVIQEWWGLNPSIKEMADRLATAGFVALCPDLYHGELAAHDEVDKAAALMQQMPAERAARDMSGAIDYLTALDGVTGTGIGVVGFCMGGMLAFLLAANRPDKVGAIVPFYGFPQGDSVPDWTTIRAAIRGHMAENDDFFPAQAARALEAQLVALGKDAVLTVHPGTGHAFMGPHNAFGTLDEAAAARIWPDVITFLRDTLRSPT